MYMQQCRLISLVAGHVCVLVMLGTLLCVGGLASGLLRAFAQAHCASSDRTYAVRGGDTLSAIAARYHTNWQSLARYNHFANPDRISIGETICIPGASSVHQPVRGKSNAFLYGECTWWANQRYHQLYGVYVPWLSQSNAWQWTARARQFYWRVSRIPLPGAIINLQPWIQGAYGLGHVAVVERVLANGHVITSNMNWGARPDAVTYIEFSPGQGVTFISF
jgi:murein DD-endopeptidase MepM/ murein hydrolase activator NlpD